MKNGQKVVSKYLRLRMTDDLREMLRKIPVEDVTETQAGSHIYMGSGKVRVGPRTYPVIVRVWMKEDEVWASVRSFGSRLSISSRFRNAAERREFVSNVLEGVEKCRSK
jgi:hypothetical protein